MRMKRIAIAVTLSLVLLCFLLTGGSKVWAESISVAEYRLRIQESLAHLKEGEGQIGPEEISWFGESFPSDLVVEDSTGEQFLVDRKDLFRWAKDAEDSPQGRKRLAAYQQALLQEISRWTGETLSEASGWGEYRNLLDEVYRGKEFRYLKKREDPAWRQYIARLLEDFGRWLQDHLGFLGTMRTGWIVYVAYGIVLVLGAVLIIWISRLFGPVGWRWKYASAPPPPSTKTSPERNWQSWREEAKKKAQEGAFREAIRSLFISVLMEGHQKGWWVYEPEATNREHLARVEGQSERREVLQSLIDRYELAWYGLRQPGREEFQDCERWVKRLEVSA
jgi:hypothetical protein